MTRKSRVLFPASFCWCLQLVNCRAFEFFFQPNERDIIATKIDAIVWFHINLNHRACHNSLLFFVNYVLGVEEPFFYLANEWHKLHGETVINMADMA